MKRILAPLLAALAVILAGCPSIPPVTGGPVMRELANGVIEHSASGMQFPLACEGFIRSGTRQYDAGGLDVSAAYNLPSLENPITITVYVYPSPPLRSFGSPQSVIDDARSTLSRNEFRQCQQEIIRAHPDARLIAESEIPAASSGLARPGLHAGYSFSEAFAGHLGPVESLLYVHSYVGGAWTIKYRISFPPGDEARAAVDRFVRNLRSTIKTPA